VRIVSSGRDVIERPRRRLVGGWVLARENELMRAALRVRDEGVRRDRARLAQAGDAARRRLERDLHDGAQQRLVALGLDLRLLEARVAGTDLAPALAALSEGLSAALADLRDLARGMYPAILTSRGLGPALHALAVRTPLPVRVDVEAMERPPEHVEVTAYFVVAEALTNVARHARAREATVVIRRRGPDLLIGVTDDGAGGADIAGGTGLLGLRDRLGAIGGSLAVESAPGSGTWLRAVLPVPAEPEARGPIARGPDTEDCRRDRVRLTRLPAATHAGAAR
jgi:signal transduction histidine kinase